VVVADRDEKRGSIVAEEIGGHFLACDITERGKSKASSPPIASMAVWRRSSTAPASVLRVDCSTARASPPDEDVRPDHAVNVYGTFNISDSR